MVVLRNPKLQQDAWQVHMLHQRTFNTQRLHILQWCALSQRQTRPVYFVSLQSPLIYDAHLRSDLPTFPTFRSSSSSDFYASYTGPPHSCHNPIAWTLFFRPQYAMSRFRWRMIDETWRNGAHVVVVHDQVESDEDTYWRSE
jgi:hypothetical protein